MRFFRAASSSSTADTGAINCRGRAVPGLGAAGSVGREQEIDPIVFREPLLRPERGLDESVSRRCHLVRSRVQIALS